MKFFSYISVTFLLLSCLSGGCRAPRTQSTESAATDSSAKEGSVTLRPEVADAPEITIPAEGFSWDALALIAAQRSVEARMTALRLESNRLQNRLELTPRDPQLRLNSAFDTERDYKPGDGKTREESEDYGASLRFYISSPFVNRWIRKQSAYGARAIVVADNELAYAVRCETMMKCLDAAILEERIRQAEESLEIRRQTCAGYRELERDGLAAPLKILKAEINLAETEQQLDRLRREHRNALHQIALLTGLEARQIKLLPVASSALPPPQTLDIDALTATAVRLRPDLQSVRCEAALAQTGLEIARARQIPWFEYAESGFSNSRSDSTRYSRNGASHSDSRSAEWNIRTAVSLPFFSWAGHETALASSLLRETELREARLLTNIRDEIRNAVENYHDAFTACERTRNATENHLQAFNTALKEIDETKAALSAEILETEERLHAFRAGARQNIYDCIRIKLYIQSLTGGALPE